jgi:putative FmdB family regulatory protein
MPIYEYRCGSCEHEFEELVSMGAPAPPCPSCGQQTERQLSGLAVGRKGRVSAKAQIHDAKRSAEKAAASKKD